MFFKTYFSSWCWTRSHDILWLQQTTHDIKHGCFANRSSLSLNSQWSITSHQKVTTTGTIFFFFWKLQFSKMKMTLVWIARFFFLKKKDMFLPWSWNQTCHQSNHIIVHVTRITQCSCTGSHHCAHKRIRFRKRRRFQSKTIRSNSIQSWIYCWLNLDISVFFKKKKWECRE